MDLSRRRFLAVVAAATAPASQVFAGAAFASRSIDTGAPCVLPESRAGYRKALAGRDLRGLVVVPGAAGWDPTLPQRVRDGQWVIFESAAGFADAGPFEEQRAGLAGAFDLVLEAPCAPWHESARPPYVSLEWPAPALVRDFSSLVGVRGGQTIGRFGDLPVAALRRSGAGALIVLGSALGPALWSDDARAHAWLESVVAQVASPSA